MVAPVVRQIDMSAPSTISTDVTLTDNVTGLDFQTLSTPNRLIDITNAVDPSSTTYILKLMREGREVRRWAPSMLLQTIDRHVGFPVDMRGGQVQWVGQQTLGTLAAFSYMLTFIKDL